MKYNLILLLLVPFSSFSQSKVFGNYSIHNFQLDTTTIHHKDSTKIKYEFYGLSIKSDSTFKEMWISQFNKIDTANGGIWELKKDTITFKTTGMWLKNSQQKDFTFFPDPDLEQTERFIFNADTLVGIDFRKFKLTKN